MVYSNNKGEIHKTTRVRLCCYRVAVTMTMTTVSRVAFDMIIVKVKTQIIQGVAFYATLYNNIRAPNITFQELFLVCYLDRLVFCEISIALVHSELIKHSTIR